MLTPTICIRKNHIDSFAMSSPRKKQWDTYIDMCPTQNRHRIRMALSYRCRLQSAVQVNPLFSRSPSFPFPSP